MAKKPTTRKPTTKKPTTKDIVDTEGQGFKMKADEGDATVEDTEGNRIKLIKDSAVDGDEPEDTEGNRIKLIKDSAVDGDEPEDTEGNRIKFIR